MAKKENLPVNVDLDTEQGSNIIYANEVVAIIAGVAASEVEGIAGMCNVSGGLLGKNRSVTKGVKVEIGTEEASVDLYVIIEYGKPIQKVAYDAQESVRKAIETMTGLHVVKVDVHVQGVSFEKENNALNAGARNAVLTGKSKQATLAESAKTTADVQAEVPDVTEEASEAPVVAADDATSAESETANAEYNAAEADEAPAEDAQEAETADEEKEDEEEKQDEVLK